MGSAAEAAARRRLLAKSKHRWLRACTLFPPIRDSPMQLRVAMLLWDCFNTTLGVAYPSRQTMAEKLNVAPTNVSHALNRFKRLNMIHVVSLRDIGAQAGAHLGRRDPRGHVYSLNFEWAEAVLRDTNFDFDDGWLEAAE